MKRKFITPEYVTADEIRQVRKSLGITQKDFAELIGVSKPTVERWESSDGHITGPIVFVTELLRKHKINLQDYTIPPRVMPIRMWYMYKNTKCTLIDVDEGRREVSICNYINNMQFRAFGVREKPTYDDYCDFLESRCFPRSRDNMKLILKDLNLPFYDPFMIVQKTKGRMAEDDFWIDIEG